MKVVTASQSKQVTFFNWSDRTFTWMWAGNPITIPAGEKAMMEEGIARVFAIHLAEREAPKYKVIAVRKTDDFIKLANRALPEGGTVDDNEFQAKPGTRADMLNALSSESNSLDAAISLPGDIMDAKMTKEQVEADMAHLDEELVKENAKNLKRIEPEKKKLGRPKKVLEENKEFAGLHETPDKAGSEVKA